MRKTVFDLKRTKQWEKCPWKENTSPSTIPNGYSLERHQSLKDTIANRDNYDLTEELKIMACHDSPLGDEQPCVGWLHNQLGTGNNIKLRIWMIDCTNADCITVECGQHSTFEETIK